MPQPYGRGGIETRSVWIWEIGVQGMMAEIEVLLRASGDDRVKDEM